MDYIPYNQQADPMYYWSQFANNLIGGLMQQQQKKNIGQDVQSILGYNQQMQQQPGPMPTGDIGALGQWATQAKAPQMPQMQSPMGNQMMLQGLLGGLTQSQSPLQQMQMLKTSRELQKPFYQPGVIENIETGEQRPYTYGEPIPQGYKIVREAQTVVNVGGQGGLTPATRTQLQGDIKEIDDMLTMVNQIEEMTEEPFLTYKGSAKAWFEREGEKLDVRKASDYLSRYSAWKSMAQDIYLKKRKQITGVAARPEEKSEIAQAVPDPTKNSYTEFVSKNNQLKRLLETHKKRYEYVLKQGVINPTKGDLAKYSLEQFRSGVEAPTSKEDFQNMLNSIENEKEARQYYNKWIDRFEW